MKTTAHSVLFWRTTDIYSQWHPRGFTIDDVVFSSAEQYMMVSKARLFKDTAVEVKMLATDNVRALKALGRDVQGYDEAVWVANRERIVYEGNLAKFEQNKDLGDQLWATQARKLIEASPDDKIWGTGLAEDHIYAEDPLNWPGLNLLGIALMRVRETLNGRIRARLNGWPLPLTELSPTPTPRFPKLIRPTEEAANEMGKYGAPHLEAERLLFEAYMAGHNWVAGPWDAEKRCYAEMTTRMLWAVWRDRSALAFQVEAPTVA